MLRSMWRGLETESRSGLHGHERGNPGYRQGHDLTGHRASPRPYRSPRGPFPGLRRVAAYHMGPLPFVCGRPRCPGVRRSACESPGAVSTLASKVQYFHRLATGSNAVGPRDSEKGEGERGAAQHDRGMVARGSGGSTAGPAAPRTPGSLRLVRGVDQLGRREGFHRNGGGKPRSLLPLSRAADAGFRGARACLLGTASALVNTAPPSCARSAFPAVRPQSEARRRRAVRAGRLCRPLTRQLRSRGCRGTA